MRTSVILSFNRASGSDLPYQAPTGAFSWRLTEHPVRCIYIDVHALSAEAAEQSRGRDRSTALGDVH